MSSVKMASAESLRGIETGLGENAASIKVANNHENALAIV